MRLLLIRHGETTANAERRLQGHVDFALSERGRRESEQAAERLAGSPIDALYTSPLRRARETADIVAARLGMEAIERPALMERDVGVLGGLTRDEIQAQYPEYVRARMEGKPAVGVEGYESDGDFRGRVLAGLEEIADGHREQFVVVVSHGGVINAYCRYVLGVPEEQRMFFAVRNASINVFDVRDGEVDPRRWPRVQLVTFNDTCHLEG